MDVQSDKRYGMCKATNAMECAKRQALSECTKRQALWNEQSDTRYGMRKATSDKASPKTFHGNSLCDNVVTKGIAVFRGTFVANFPRKTFHGKIPLIATTLSQRERFRGTFYHKTSPKTFHGNSLCGNVVAKGIAVERFRGSFASKLPEKRSTAIPFATTLSQRELPWNVFEEALPQNFPENVPGRFLL